MSTARVVLGWLLPVLPARLRRIVGTFVLRWDIHPTAHLGRSVVIAEQVTLGPGARIGPGNVIKGLSELRLDDNAIINGLNWISGPPKNSGAFASSPNRHPALIMKSSAAITARHIIDCSDTVVFEDFAILSGIRSTIFTHSVNLVRNQQRTGRVTIGARTAILSNSLILAGIAIAPRSIVSAGSVVNTALTKELVFYRGNPAVEVRELPADLAFFHRTAAWLD